MTPRTDKAAFPIGEGYNVCPGDSTDVVTADFARELERELTRERALHLPTVADDFAEAKRAVDERWRIKELEHLLSEVVRTVPIIIPQWRSTYLYERCREAVKS